MVLKVLKNRSDYCWMSCQKGLCLISLTFSCSTLCKCSGFWFKNLSCSFQTGEGTVFSKDSKCRYLLTKYHMVGGKIGFSLRCGGVWEWWRTNSQPRAQKVLVESCACKSRVAAAMCNTSGICKNSHAIETFWKCLLKSILWPQNIVYQTLVFAWVFCPILS